MRAHLAVLIDHAPRCRGQNPSFYPARSWILTWKGMTPSVWSPIAPPQLNANARFAERLTGRSCV